MGIETLFLVIFIVGLMALPLVYWLSRRLGRRSVRRRFAILSVAGFVSVFSAGACGVEEQVQQRVEEEVQQRVDEQVQGGEQWVEEQLQQGRTQIEEQAPGVQKQVEEQVQDMQKQLEEQVGEGQ